jgi:hypothetical protein
VNPEPSAAPDSPTDHSFALADLLPRFVAELRAAAGRIAVPPPTEYERGQRDGLLTAADLIDGAIELSRNPPG